MKALQKKKGLGLWMLTALVAGNMIGSGIFLLPAALAKIGTISLISWVFTATGAFFLAIVFAQLGQYYPLTGGPYAYCREAYGDFLGFLVAFNYWVELWVGNAAIVTAFTSYLSVFFPVLSQHPAYACGLSISTVWFLTYINILGIRTAGFVQIFTTLLKLLPLILISIVGLFYFDLAHLSEFNISGQSTTSAITSAAALTLWAFIGVESATVPADEVENPKKNIPRATLLGTGIAAIVYIASTFAIMGAVPMSVLSHSAAPYALAAAAFWGPVGQTLMTLGAIIASFGALNGWILLQGEIPMAAAQDTLFPPIFAKMNKAHRPYMALIISAILITLLLLFTLSASLVDQFTVIIRFATLATLLTYLFSTMARILLQLKNPEAFQGSSFWKGSLIAGIAFLYCFWAVIGLGPETVFYGTLLFFAAVPIYTFMFFRLKAA